MACKQLWELSMGSQNQSVCVRISRLWNYRGPNEDGPLLQTDMVAIDGQGGHMTVMIAAQHVNLFYGKINEGKVYQFRRFRVTPAELRFRAVRAARMIKFSANTEVHEIHDVPVGFPQITYRVMPYQSIPRPCLQPRYFTDVIGALVSVSDLTIYTSKANPVPAFRRQVTIKNLVDALLQVVLWGECAARFKGSTMLDIGQEPVVIIFIGTLVKRYTGDICLGGRIACRWYVNEDIPMFNVHRAGFALTHRPVRREILEAKHGVPASLENCAFIDMPYQGDEYIISLPIREETPPQPWYSDDGETYEAAIASAEAVLAD